VEWIDIGAQWDNLPGEDDLPGYDADESRTMARALAEKLKKPIADAKEAFTVRCLDCHDVRRMQPVRNTSQTQVRSMVARMVAKRKGWIHDSEMPLILGHIQEVYAKKLPAKKPPAKKPPAAKKPAAKKAPAKKAPAKTGGA